MNVPKFYKIKPLSCKECKHFMLDKSGIKLCKLVKFNKNEKNIPVYIARKSEKLCGPEGKYFTLHNAFYYPDYLSIDEYF